MTNLEIRNIVENLRRKAGIFKKSGCATTGIVKCFEESADTIEQLAEEFKQLKDKQEQGLLIELPCKEGDTVYTIHSISPTKHIVCEIKNVDRFRLLLAVTEERFGKDIFLTRSEAEEALAKMKKED